MKRRTWLTGLGIAVVAAAGAFFVYVIAAWALSLVAPNLWFEANMRARVADDIGHLADRLEAQHTSRAVVAQALVNRVRTISRYDAAVIDDDGKFITGSQAVLGDRPPGMPLPPPFPPQRVPQRGELRSQIFGMHPPVAHDIAFIRLPFSAISSPMTMVRFEGGAVFFGPTSDPLESIQQLERWLIAGILLAIFLLVWFFTARGLEVAARPSERLREALLRLAEGDYARFENFGSKDDDTVGLLQAYNAAAAKVEDVSKQRSEIETKIRQFVADAGHELRTPLAVIMGYVQLLRQGGDVQGPMAMRVFTEIDDQGKRMSTLIQKLLFLTRLESQEPTDVKILDAADVATSVMDSFRPLANGAILRVDAQPDSFVQVSESELHEAVGNLIDNALKYAPGAQIEARVKADGNMVSIAVSDTGPGMTPDVRGRAFERFSRGEMGGSVTGSGLGLAIVERAVERAGGSVTLRSAIGQGTTVELRLPAWQAGRTSVNFTRSDSSGNN